MEIEIVEKRENALLERLEVKFKVAHPGGPTPSRDEISEKLASSLKSSKEKVILDRMRAQFGRGLSEGYAKVYKTMEAAKRHERTHVLARNRLISPDKKSDEKKESGAGSDAKK